MADKRTVKERLAIIETLLTNHLEHHKTWLTMFIIPILVGVILNFLGTSYVIMQSVLK
jgi:hypothetical protein